MSNTLRANRKALDNDIIQLNNMGLSLKAIGERLGIHPTTAKGRLNDMGIPVTDTRRAFMEDIHASLDPSAQDWLASQVQEGSMNVKQLVTHLITQASIMNRSAA